MFAHTTITKLTDTIYLLDEEHRATGYLVLGTEKAALIDTMCGLDDLSAIVRSITDLPVIVLNTHGHPDHVGGNIYFGEGYMNPKDYDLARSFFDDAVRSGQRDSTTPCPVFQPLLDGDMIDIGGTQLEVIELPGHTPGGVLLLDRADGTLYTGDSINWHTWMQLDHCLPMHEFLANLEAIAPRLTGVKRILHGHAQGFDGPELIDYHREAVREVVLGKTEHDEDYTYFGGKVKAHPYHVEPMRIIYDPARPV